jgi:hypothetical protein
VDFKTIQEMNKNLDLIEFSVKDWTELKEKSDKLNDFIKSKLNEIKSFKEKILNNYSFEPNRSEINIGKLYSIDSNGEKNELNLVNINSSTLTIKIMVIKIMITLVEKRIF